MTRSDLLQREAVAMQEPWRSALAFILVIAALLLLLRLFHLI